ncbi:MvdC/MvdD family ATP grasp protein [Amycolatopsis sp. CA-230715]|uniref:MvdC/MvdD family ATP grasp protein n=1 Tax=Amycolatopsis sp. CA-230715 TaxID=2745196 RepID=UPI001C024DCB|nr:hypothetical protein [Amycolatopsis sp. CA-230715]QWF78678.1 hypothetical protein HUW46_02076 [Amycolatopsis sp. CA-230715]
MIDPFVLVLGDVAEWSAAEVAGELDARGIRWTAVDTIDFPLRMSMDVRLDQDAVRWAGELETGDSRVRLDEVTAVYYCKPRDFEMPSGLSGPELRFSRAQARTGFGGVLASLPVRWVSHPSALADAEYKPRQLTRLRAAGLQVPPTLVTNRGEGVREFAARYGPVVIKPLAEPIVWEGDGETVVYTRRLTAADLDDLAGIEITAHLVQQWQDKACEPRVIAVGDQVFAVAIHAESPAGRIDWRTDYDSHRYEVIDVPDQVREGVFRYLRLAGLASSVFDFVVRPDGAWVALEANTTGSWGWLADACDLPIAAAFADTLTKE